MDHSFTYFVSVLSHDLTLNLNQNLCLGHDVWYNYTVTYASEMLVCRLHLSPTHICPSGMVPIRVREVNLPSSRCSSSFITSPPLSGKYNVSKHVTCYFLTCYINICIICYCRWEVIGDDGIQYGPFPVPQDGLPIKICPLNEDN